LDEAKAKEKDLKVKEGLAKQIKDDSEKELKTTEAETAKFMTKAEEKQVSHVTRRWGLGWGWRCAFPSKEGCVCEREH
jgi:hypothetical protein